MGVFDSVKQRLGIGEKRDTWNDSNYDDYVDDGYNERYDDFDDDYNDDMGSSRELGAEQRETRRPTVKLVGRSENLTSQTRSSRRPYSSGSYSSSTSSAAGFDDEPGFLKNRGSQANAANSIRSRASSLLSRSDDREARMDADDSYGGESYDDGFSARSSYGDQRAESAYDPYSDYIGSSSTTSRPRPMLKTLSPRSYNEANQIADAMKTGSQVVVSLRDVRPELAKRILDFSFGVACALDGKVEKIGDKVFLFSQDTTILTDEQRHQLQKSGIL